MSQTAGLPLPFQLPTGTVRGTSDASLAADVALRATGSSKVVTAVPALHGAWPVGVIDLLHLLGQVSTPAAPLTSGPHSFQWPMLKYLYFFEDIGGELCAGAEADWYSHHGRTAVSDELGVGFSLLAAQRWLESQYQVNGIRFFDVEGCLSSRYGTRAPQVSQIPSSKKRPDWIVSGAPVGNPLRRNFFLLESKGTKLSSRTKHVEILASAVEQLASVTVNGAILPGLATRTVSGRGHIQVWAVDPPSHQDGLVGAEVDNERARKYHEERLLEKQEPPSATEIVLGQAGPARAGRGREGKEPPPVDLDAEDLVDHEALLDAERLAQWSADPDLVEATQGKEAANKAKIAWRKPKATINTRLGLATGSLMELPGGSATLFTGILQRFQAPVRELDFEAVAWLQSVVGQDEDTWQAPPAGSLDPHQVSITANGLVTAIITRR